MPYHILPSLLSANLLRLGEEVQEVLAAGAEWVHLDVMDNHYVPNLTFGPLFCQALRQQFPQLPIDVHLMLSPVDASIEAFAQAGATRISIHPEASLHVDRSLQLIRANGCQAGLALNPATPIEVLQWCIDKLDFVLIMTVNPGFGGQGLIPGLDKKIKQIHQLYPKLTLCVDGGINQNTIKPLAQAGASEFVVGSALFHSGDYKQCLKTLHHTLNA